MKYVAGFLFCWFLFLSNAMAKLVSGDVLISSDAYVSNETWYITDSVEIENNGVIKNDIYVCNMCDVYVKNTGVISANFYLGQGAKIIQVRSNTDDITHVDFGGVYSVKIDDADGVALDSVAKIAYGADKIVITDSTVILNGIQPDVPLEINGEVEFVINSIDDYDDLVLRNVSGRGTVRFVTNNQNALYNYSGYIDGGNLYIDTERETDYDQVFDDALGDAFEDVRDENPDDPLLDKIDTAPNMDEIINFMNQSARFNPDVLRRPLEIINAMDMVTIRNINTGINIAPWWIRNSDFNLIAADVNFGVRINDALHISVGGRYAQMMYENDFDKFDAQIYGGNLRLKYQKNNDVFINLMGGMSVARFDIGNVYYDEQKLYNPDVLFGYGALDVGYQFAMGDSVYLTPFVGLQMDGYKIENINLINTEMRSGLNVGYVFDVLGVKYKYAIGINANPNGDIAGDLRIGAWSDIDGFGGNIGVSAVRMYDTVSYKLSADITVGF